MPYSLQGLATRWLASLPGRASQLLAYTPLSGRTIDLTPIPMGFLIIHLIFAIEREYVFLPDPVNLVVISHGPDQHDLPAKPPLIRFSRVQAVDLQGK